MALVHKTKKKTQRKQQIFKIKLRKDKVKMFGPHSKPISVVQAWFKADFGCWPIQFDSADTTRFWPNRPVLAKIKAKSAWIPKKKKKNSDVAPTHRQRCRWPHPMSGHVRLWWGSLPVALLLPSLYSKKFWCKETQWSKSLRKLGLSPRTLCWFLLNLQCKENPNNIKIWGIWIGILGFW